MKETCPLLGIFNPARQDVAAPSKVLLCTLTPRNAGGDVLLSQSPLQ